MLGVTALLTQHGVREHPECTSGSSAVTSFGQSHILVGNRCLLCYLQYGPLCFFLGFLQTLGKQRLPPHPLFAAFLTLTLASWPSWLPFCHLYPPFLDPNLLLSFWVHPNLGKKAIRYGGGGGRLCHSGQESENSV